MLRQLELGGDEDKTHIIITNLPTLSVSKITYEYKIPNSKYPTLILTLDLEYQMLCARQSQSWPILACHQQRGSNLLIQIVA